MEVSYSLSTQIRTHSGEQGPLHNLRFLWFALSFSSSGKNMRPMHPRVYDLQFSSCFALAFEIPATLLPVRMVVFAL